MSNAKQAYPVIIRSICYLTFLIGLVACSNEPDEATIQTAIAQTQSAEEAATVVAQANEDRIATSVAETLAAQAVDPTNTPIPPTDTPIPPTATPAPVNTNTPLPPTNTPVPPTDTPIPPTDTPIPPTATPPPFLLGASPVDGDDGNDFLRGSLDDNQGRNILLPSFAQDDVNDPMVFRDRIVFRVEVFDTREGLQDGAGIQDVDFKIVKEDGSNDVVHERTERTAGYCVFGGGEPDCNILVFAESDNRWPGGEQITSGEYLAEIDINPENGDSTQWRWRFNIETDNQDNQDTAQITQIWINDGQYQVDFEVSGYQPNLPGQHVHFFYDNVSPENAGVPGSGPWQIYPVGPGESGQSPFTLFSPANRPPNASKICVLVANPDHSVQLGSGNCVDLP